MRKSDIPARFRIPFEPINPPQVAAVDTTEKLFYGPRGTKLSLFLTGGVGTGKTMFSCAALQRWIETGRWGVYVNYSDLLATIRQSFGQYGVSEFDILDRYIRTPLLVVDELGAEKVTEFSVDRLMQLVNARYADNRRTIWVSNYPLSKLADRMTIDDGVQGQRIVSRIYEESEIVQFDGEDMRTSGVKS